MNNVVTGFYRVTSHSFIKHLYTQPHINVWIIIIMFEYVSICISFIFLIKNSIYNQKFRINIFRLFIVWFLETIGELKELTMMRIPWNINLPLLWSSVIPGILPNFHLMCGRRSERNLFRFYLRIRAI